MSNEGVWAIWIVGAFVIGFSGLITILEDGPSKLKKALVILAAIWIGPVAINAWLRMVAM